jgi:hypothetical protein
MSNARFAAVPKTSDTLNKLQQELERLSSIKYDGEKVVAKSPHKSSGDCAGHVRRALNAALGLDIPPVNDAATDFPAKLKKAGFKKVTMQRGFKPLPGDIAIIASVNDDHPFGHAAMLGLDGKWWSDFAQASGIWGAWPYETAPLNTKLFTFYRSPKLSQNAVVTQVVAPTDANKVVATLSAKLSSAPQMASMSGGILTVTMLSAAVKKPSTTNAITLAKSKKRNPEPPATTLLQRQWSAARKAVLERNAALKNDGDVKLAQDKLQKSVKKMQGHLTEAMRTDPLLAFKAARYVFNKYDDKKLYAANESASNKQDILKLIKDSLDEIALRDPKMHKQAANFVFNNAGKGELRESVRDLLPKKARGAKTLCA